MSEVKPFPGKEVHISSVSLDNVERLTKTGVLKKIDQESYNTIDAQNLYARFSGAEFDYKRKEITRFIEETLVHAAQERRRAVGQLIKDIPPSLWDTLPSPVMKHVYRTFVRSYLLNSLSGANGSGVHRAALGMVAVESAIFSAHSNTTKGGFSSNAMQEKILQILSAEDRKNIDEEEWQLMKREFESMQI
jgi:hypothetical protein